MERLINARATSHPWRCWLALLLGLLSWASVQAATPLTGAWREVRANDTPQQVLEEYRAGSLKNFTPSLLHRFSQDALGSWVVLAPQPLWGDSEPVLTIYPAPLNTVTLFDGQQRRPLALDSVDAPLHGHGRLAWRLAAPPGGQTLLLLKFEPSPTLNAPVRFDVQPLSTFLQQDARWLTFATLCLAVMLAMVLMALCFALMLRDVTYAWYAGYIICYSLIQGMQTGFVFQPLQWQWLSGMTATVGPVAVALSVAFASLFMMRFCELHRHAPILRVPITALAVGMLLLAAMRCSQVTLLTEVAQTLLNPLLMIGVVLALVAALAAGARGSRQAWFFLAGWAPLLVLTALTSAQIGGALPELDWLNDASLAAGAFEAVVLSLGLADRTLRLRHDRDTVRVLADRDALTNIYNRRAWTELANTALAAHPTRPMALLFLDLDRFKVLNDEHGHHAGDRALVTVSEALTNELRPGDLFGRYGGEEFVALLDATTAEQATQIATRLCRRVHRLEIPVVADSLLLSISVGIAIRTAHEDLESLVKRADQAMYTAKLGGRNRAVLHAATGPTSPRLHIVEANDR